MTPAPTKFCGTCGSPLVYQEEEVTVIAPPGPLPDAARRPEDDMRTVLDQPALDPRLVQAHQQRDDMKTLFDAPRAEPAATRSRPTARTYIAGSTMPTRDGLPPVTTPDMPRPPELTRAPALGPMPGAVVPRAAPPQARDVGPAGTERLPNMDGDLAEGERMSSTAVFDYEDAANQGIAAPALAPPVLQGARPQAQAPAAPKPAGRQVQRTMLGMPSPLGGGAPAAPGPRGAPPTADATIRGMPTPADQPAAPRIAAAAGPQARVAARTMVGSAALPASAPAGLSPVAPPYDPSSRAMAPRPSGDAPASPPAQTLQPIAIAHAAGGEPSPTVELSQSTVGKLSAIQPRPQPDALGYTGPLLDPRQQVPGGFGPPGAPPPFGAGVQAPAPGVPPAPGAPQQIFPGAHPFSQPPAGFGEPSADVSISAKPKKKGGRGCAAVLLVSGLLLLVAAGGALGYFLLIAPAGQRNVTASVVRDAAGAEELAVQVLGAPSGTRVRFSGQEQPVANGRARFPMPAQQLRIGENRLTLEVLRPGKPADAHEVRLTVDYRVRADLTPLAADPPGYDVVVDARPRSAVQVDGRAVTLDAAGHGAVRVALAAVPGSQDGAAALVHTVRYRIAPADGAPSDGTLTTQIPRTTLSVDRPGPQTVTDRASIELAGGTDPGATVTVDGAAVPVDSGRFVLRRALEVGAVTLTVRATAPGKAPATTSVLVRRVADLEAEARTFQVDAEVTYGRLAVNPNLYRGRRAGFSGLVYNMRVEQGQTIIQLLVRDCPQGQRCALWVVFRGDTDATVGAQVRVLGTVAGEQTFRTPQGAQVTVPRLDAALVLPLRS